MQRTKQSLRLESGGGSWELMAVTKCEMAGGGGNSGDNEKQASFTVISEIESLGLPGRCWQEDVKLCVCALEFWLEQQMGWSVLSQGGKELSVGMGMWAV